MKPATHGRDDRGCLPSFVSGGAQVARWIYARRVHGDVYRFEELDEGLDLVPLAGRRALDRAGRKLGLEAWRRLSLADRSAITNAGARDVVDVVGVQALVATMETSRIEARAEPDAQQVPAEVAASLEVPLSPAGWAALRPLDRWVLDSLASRGRTETLRAALSELGLA